MTGVPQYPHSLGGIREREGGGRRWEPVGCIQGVQLDLASFLGYSHFITYNVRVNYRASHQLDSFSTLPFSNERRLKTELQFHTAKDGHFNVHLTRSTSNTFIYAP